MNYHDCGEDHFWLVLDTPRQTVTLDTAEEEEEGEEAYEHPKTGLGIKLSDLEFSVFGDYAVVPSIEVITLYNNLVCVYMHHCVFVEIAASSINDKTTTTNITRGVGIISRSEWTHLCSQSGSIPSQSVLWSEYSNYYVVRWHGKNFGSNNVLPTFM